MKRNIVVKCVSTCDSTSLQKLKSTNSKFICFNIRSLFWILIVSILVKHVYHTHTHCLVKLPTISYSSIDHIKVLFYSFLFENSLEIEISVLTKSSEELLTFSAKANIGNEWIDCVLLFDKIDLKRAANNSQTNIENWLEAILIWLRCQIHLITESNLFLLFDSSK